MAGTSEHTDHRRSTEELLSQLAGLLYEDVFAEQVRQNRRRRTAARRSIASRLSSARRARAAAVA
jgi:hypothetical protein